MAGKSLNKVQLIGNMTADPELRYTPTGAAVCSFGLATNRNWTTDAGEKRDEVEFHRLVAWRKLAEICGQYLKKGSKIYAEGHLATRKWTTKDAQERYTTEIILDDMIMLDGKRVTDESPTQFTPKPAASTKHMEEKPSSEHHSGSTNSVNEPAPTEDMVSPDDIPF